MASQATNPQARAAARAGGGQKRGSLKRAVPAGRREGGRLPRPGRREGGGPSARRRKAAPLLSPPRRHAAVATSRETPKTTQTHTFGIGKALSHLGIVPERRVRRKGRHLNGGGAVGGMGGEGVPQSPLAQFVMAQNDGRVLGGCEKKPLGNPILGPPRPLPPSRGRKRGGRGGSLRRRDPGSMYRSRRNYYLLLLRWAASTILTSFRPPPPTNTHRSGSGGRFCDTGKCRTAPCKRAETYFLGFFSPGWALHCA